MTATNRAPSPLVWRAPKRGERPEIKAITFRRGLAVVIESSLICPYFVPVSSSQRVVTTRHAFESWQATDHRPWWDDRTSHPDLPRSFAAMQWSTLPDGEGEQVVNLTTPRGDYMIEASEARALAWELLHAADMAEDAAAEAAAKVAAQPITSGGDR